MKNTGSEGRAFCAPARKKHGWSAIVLQLRGWVKAAVDDDATVVARSNQGIILRYHQQGDDLAIKVPAGKGPVRWASRWMIRREYRIYRRLEDVPGVARCHGLLDGHALVLDYVHGQPLRDASIPDRERFFARLLETIQALHRRGVAHGDLKRKANLMVTETGDPVIVDFGAAIARKPGWRPLNHRLFKLLRRTDLNAWVKLKHGGYADVPDADREYLRPSRMERWLRKIRNRL